MGAQIANPMAEYLLKLQLIIRNTEFKNKEEANKYETLDSRLNGDAYVRAVLGTDNFESYQYDGNEVYNLLMLAGYPQDRIKLMLDNSLLLPRDIRETLLNKARAKRIAQYDEPNKYYVTLSGKPFKGNSKIPAETILRIPDEFYERYKSDTVILKSHAIHELPIKYQELFMNSEFYKPMLDKYPNALWLRYIGSNSIPIEVSRPAHDGDILRINESKLSTYHHIFGNVSVDTTIVHAFSNVYKSTRDYVYNTLRGDFSQIYPNYNSLIRFLTIYMAIGACMNEFQKKSSKLIYMNNVTANNYFMMYGLPSVIMEGKPMTEFLKKFRLLLMDKGTNVVYRVKDLIGYEYTDIYTLIMVKQQVFENGIPVYHYNDDGTKTPVCNIVFRRFGTADDNTSYFSFRESKKEYSLEEITSGDPRWWNCTEVDTMLEDMNYTLSNSKYIQLSTHMSMSDIWWQCTILLRGLLDRWQETGTQLIDISRTICGTSTMTVYGAVLTLVVLMHWQLIDAFGNNMQGNMYIPDNGKLYCIDKLFNGLTGFVPNPLKDGLPYKISSFNFDIIRDNYNEYMAMREYEYLEPEIFITMVDNAINLNNSNTGDMLMTDVKLIYKYLEDKLVKARTIHQFRQVTNAFKALFLVDPVRNWYEETGVDVVKILAKKYKTSTTEIDELITYFKPSTTPDFVITYNEKEYEIYIYDIMNNNVYDLSINDEYVFRDNTFVDLFDVKMLTYSNNSGVVNSSLSPVIRENYKHIIIDKVDFDLGSSRYGPTTFENLLMVQDPLLYEYLIQRRSSNKDDILLLIRSIIKALEEYTNTSLAGLQLKSLGVDEYFRILKEVISYFKSYMVEFTKEELTYIFGGLFDNGGNSDMLKLYDEMTHGTVDMTPSDSLTLYDVSHADVYNNMNEEGISELYDDAIFRIQVAYKNIKEAGYDIWYDNGKRITRNQSFNIDDDTEVIANFVKNQNSYKVIINIENVDDGYPPGYYGNVL